jgi:hypothetical protein
VDKLKSKQEDYLFPCLRTPTPGYKKRKCKQGKGAAVFVNSFLLGIDETTINCITESEAQNRSGVPEVGSAHVAECALKQVSDLIWPVRRIAAPGGALRIPRTAPIASWTLVVEVRMLVVQRTRGQRRG